MISFEKYSWLLIHCQEYFSSQMFLFIVKNISHHQCFCSDCWEQKSFWSDLLFSFHFCQEYFLSLLKRHYCVLHFFLSLICLDHSIQIKHISTQHTVKQYVWLFSDTSLSSIGGLGYSISSSSSSLPQTPPDSSSPRWDIT